jgi:hypothetical protein
VPLERQHARGERVEVDERIAWVVTRRARRLAAFREPAIEEDRAAALAIDGERVGTTPYTSLSMRAGKHEVRVSKDGYGSQARTFTMTAGGQHALELQLHRNSRPVTRRWWFWTAVVGVTAAAATGVALLLMDDASATMLPPVSCTPMAGCQ